MNHQIFAIYDLKAFAFIAPFTMPTPEMAMRTFEGCANEEGHMFNKHSADFNLFHIGEFDDELGDITVFPKKENLGLAQQFKKSIRSVMHEHIEIEAN